MPHRLLLLDDLIAFTFADKLHFVIAAEEKAAEEVETETVLDATEEAGLQAEKGGGGRGMEETEEETQ